MAAEKNTDPVPDSGSTSNERMSEPASAVEVPLYRFEDLAQGLSPVIRIACSGTEYCLRRTKAGKLVLNK